MAYDLDDFLAVPAGTETFGADIQDELLYGPNMGEFLPVPAGTETFGADVEDELLYQQRIPGMADAQSELELMDGQPVEVANMRGTLVRWKWGQVDTPHWAFGVEDPLGPQDRVEGGDTIPRWLGIEPPGPSRGYPACDPRPGPSGDVFDMDAYGRRSGMKPTGDGYGYGLADFRKAGARRPAARGPAVRARRGPRIDLGPMPVVAAASTPSDVTGSDDGLAGVGYGYGMGQTTNPLSNPLSNLFSNVAGQVVQQVVFKSQVTPSVTVQPFAPGTPGQPQPVVDSSNPLSTLLLNFVKPAVYIQTPAGVIPLEPYGTPTADYSGPIVMGATVATLVGGWMAYKAVRKLLS